MHRPDPGTFLELDGTWTRFIDDTVIDFVAVPGSFPPIGRCRLERMFALPFCGREGRYFLVSHGILSTATFSINGHELGQAGPWCEYRFEIPPAVLRPDGNLIQVTVCDLDEAFGPVPGRRFDGGIIRSLAIEWRPASFIRDVLFRSELSDDLQSAHVAVTIDIDGSDDGMAHVRLIEPSTGLVVASGAASGQHPFHVTLDRPRLWSPDRPDVYVLQVELPGSDPDAWQEVVGFRRIEVRGSDLFLNQRRLLLKGVCRHEFTHRHGYAPPEAVVRRDLERIKHAGFNYVRLVHSPHAASVCRLAAEIGLLVSEEPGTCWHDLSNDRIAAPAVECLRRTILRDRNVPSILAWFIYNECNPNREYAVRIARMCRDIDPGCLLSMADCSGQDAALIEMAAAAGLAFYGINVYATRKTFIERMVALKDRPLLITEWSGFLGQGNERQLRDFCDLFVRHSRVSEAQRLVGGSIWVWADYEEHSRPSPASIDGWTVEGLVHADGRPKPDLQILSQMCFDMEHAPIVHAPQVIVIAQAPKRRDTWFPIPLSETRSDQGALERRMDQARRIRDMDNWLTVPANHDGYAFVPPWPRLGRLLVDGIEFACSDTMTAGYPLLLGKERPEITIDIHRRVRGIAVLGHVFVGGGYPSPPPEIWSTAEPARARGALAAEYRFRFADSTLTQPLRHGVEILRHNDICRWWTPTPRGAATRPGVRSVLDTRYEIMRLDLWERSLPPAVLQQLTWSLIDPEALLLVAAISVQLAEE